MSRIQNYSAPTRLLDLSADIFSALYFSLVGGIDINQDMSSDAVLVLYALKIKMSSIKYYDSDTVSVLSNLSKLPLRSKKGKKSKESLLIAALNNRDNKDAFNSEYSTKYLLHEIREEKSYFLPLMNPKHVTSVQCVLPKLTNDRIKSQKGAYLLFGLDPNGVEKPIHILSCPSIKDVYHPIDRIYRIKIKAEARDKMWNTLVNLGITTPYILPEIDRVSGYLRKKYSWNR